jgi:DNA polymerase I-like protein with 3'-5' exonuclease and polymerase domains
MNHLLAFDVETTTINKGDPYHPDNRLVQVGFFDGTDYYTFYKDNIDIERIKELLSRSFLVGVNLKFDLAWMERLGIDTRNLLVLDVQLAEFLLTNQTKAFPSLNDCAEKYLGQTKVDNIKLNYWDKGIDTWFIPEEELTTYLKEDLRLTREVFLKQKELLLQSDKWNLFRLQCADLLVLNNMEYNGIPYDKEGSIAEGNKLNEEIKSITKTILSYTSCPSFNTSSGDHISCLLYGGTIIHEYRVPNGVYKTGQKQGQIRYSIVKEPYEQPRLIEPLKGSELKKEGYWSTDEYTLSSLKPDTKELKELVQSILKLSKLEKLRDTYFLGIPKLMEEKGWQNNILHGKFNQCVARTGRLSASEPNQQNFDPRAREFCRSEYGNV